MEKLQFIVREANKLLGTNYNLLSFDGLGANKLLQLVCDVLQTLGANAKIEDQGSSDMTLVVLSALQSIKYTPPDQTNINDFYDGFSSGDTTVIYPVLEWLLKHQIKINKRAYLAKYADKIPIPPEAAEDEDVMQSYKNYEVVINEFWSIYKEAALAKRECVQANELQGDITKMNQDIRNLIQRNQAQWDKLNNIPNKENLLHLGRNYRVCVTEQRNLIKQVKENLELVTNLEFQVKNLEDKWLRRGRYPMVDNNIFQVVQEEAHVNKIFLETQLPQELESDRNLVSVLQKATDNSCPSREVLLRSVNKVKNEVQTLMNEKLALYANTEDKLGPFRKQSSAIAQKKQEFSNDVTEMKRALAAIEDSIREKEIILFNAIGGEILHGEELRHFIAVLREKSVVYKQLRGQLQSLSMEQGIISRSLDVLKGMDASIEDAYFNANLVPNEVAQDQPSRNISDAKSLCNEFMQDISLLKTNITRIHDQLATAKRDNESINQRAEEVEDIFEDATHSITEEVSQLKEKIRELLSSIDILEKTWKTTTQSLDKSEYIFNRLIDELIDDPGRISSRNDSYLATLAKKKDENQILLQHVQESVRKLEESKREEQDTIEFYKHTESLILQKIDDDE